MYAISDLNDDKPVTFLDPNKLSEDGTTAVILSS